ncbi:hypothetical protein HRbin27_01613 [bacterium HR27]|nr:hypothetical protein HRbin27_01613 [bacterium HR27]
MPNRCRCDRDTAEALRLYDHAVLFDRDRSRPDIAVPAEELLRPHMPLGGKDVPVAELSDPVAPRDLDQFFPFRLGQCPFQHTRIRDAQGFDQITRSLCTMGVERLQGEFDEQLQVQPRLVECRGLRNREHRLTLRFRGHHVRRSSSAHQLLLADVFRQSVHGSGEDSRYPLP